MPTQKVPRATDRSNLVARGQFAGLQFAHRHHVRGATDPDRCAEAHSQLGLELAPLLQSIGGERGGRSEVPLSTGPGNATPMPQTPQGSYIFDI